MWKLFHPTKGSILFGVVLSVITIVAGVSWKCPQIVLPGLVFLAWGVLYYKQLVDKKWFVRIVDGNSNKIYGPYDTTKGADRDTEDLECDSREAFQANLKDYPGTRTIRAKPVWRV